MLQYNCRADSRLAPSQWDTPLLCNVSHWLGASLKSALQLHCLKKLLACGFLWICDICPGHWKSEEIQPRPCWQLWWVCGGWGIWHQQEIIRDKVRGFAVIQTIPQTLAKDSCVSFAVNHSHSWSTHILLEYSYLFVFFFRRGPTNKFVPPVANRDDDDDGWEKVCTCIH